MRKIKLLAVLCALFFSSKNTIAQSFTGGSNALNIGIGFIGGYSYSGYSGMNQTPALSAYYERGVTKLGPGTLGLGAGFEYRKLSYDYSAGGYSAKWTYSIIGVRGTYHPDFANTEKADAYIGLALGYGIVSYKDTYYSSLNIAGQDTYPSYFYSSFFLGGRYYFSNSLGLFAELGSGLTVLKAGVSVKF